MSSRLHSGLKMKNIVQLKIALTKSNIKNSYDNKMSVFKLYKITSTAVSFNLLQKFQKALILAFKAKSGAHADHTNYTFFVFSTPLSTPIFFVNHYLDPATAKK